MIKYSDDFLERRFDLYFSRDNPIHNHFLFDEKFRFKEWYALGRAVCKFSANRRQDGEPIYFAVLNKSEINAIATSTIESSDRLHFVAVNSGTFLNLFNIFNLFLSDPRILPSVGYANHETISECHTHSLIQDVIVNNRFTRIPNDGLRYEYAFLLTTIVSQFILFHEITHIENGHTVYFNELNNSHLEENRTKSFLDKEESICMELDADAGAINGLVWYSKLIHDGAVNQLLEGKLSAKSSYSANLYSNLEDILFMMHFGLFVYFTISAQNTSYSNTHPSIDVRTLYCHQSAINYCHFYKIFTDMNRHEEIFISAIIEAKNALNLITGMKTIDPLLDSNLLETHQFILGLETKWNTFRSKLKPLNPFVDASDISKK